MRFLLLVMLAAAPLGARAQAPSDVVPAAVEAIEAGRADEAAAALEAAWRADPLGVHPDLGAVAFWLGRARAEGGDDVSAAAAWRAGFDALAAAGRLEVRLADAHLNALLEAGTDTSSARAADVYLLLLGVAGPGWTGATGEILQRHVAEAALVAPDSVAAAAVDGDPEKRFDRWTIRPGGGERLAAWWRTRDALPATPRNERVEEHLRRVHHARMHFATDRRALGFDDRGVVYVRLGPPRRAASVRYDGATFNREVFRFGVPVQPGDFPDNAFWSYEHLHDVGYFIFTEVGGAFQLGQATDLLPVTLRGNYGPTPHDENKALSALAALRYIYEQLALEHIDFSGRYLELDGIATLELEDITEVEQELRTRELTDAIGGTVGEEERLGRISNEFREPAYQTARRVMRTSDAADTRATIQRRSEMARTYAEVGTDVPDFPVAVRSARFLDPDGTTRTEIYWSPIPGDLAPTEPQQARLATLGLAHLDRYLVRHTLVQRGADGRAWLYDVGHVALGTDPVRSPHRMVARGDTGRYFVGAQWDLLVTDRDAWEGGQPAAQIRTAARTAEPFEALPADPRRLVMSDLRPVLDDGTTTPPAYPFEDLTPTTPLGLYFELYGLAYGDDDQTRYTVEYEVRRGDDGGLRLLGGRDEAGTSARIGGESTSTTTQEYVLLDLRDWSGRGTLDVVVRVRDEVTGRTAERSVSFTLRGG